jgi:hypothetical protein
MLSFEQGSIPAAHVSKLVEADCVALGNPFEHLGSVVWRDYFDAG